MVVVTGMGRWGVFVENLGVGEGNIRWGCRGGSGGGLQTSYLRMYSVHTFILC